LNEFWNILDKGYEDLLGHPIPQKGIGSEILLVKAPVIWLDSCILESKLGFDIMTCL
jgi:hypothetical protein